MMTMTKIKSSNSVLFVSCSVILNLFMLMNIYGSGEWKLSWSRRAAAEAEAVAAIECSGHGEAFLDGLVLEGRPVCECNACYGGPDCSQFSPGCVVDADGGNPLFLEPFWREHAGGSAVVIAGWHRMGYSFDDQSFISQELERQIRKLHASVGNAVTEGRFIVFGSGSIQLLIAAVHSLSLNSSSPSKVVASTPFYAAYKMQTEFFKSLDFEFEGDASLWINNSESNMAFIEFITSPNNPDGQLKKAVLQGSSVKTIHDHAYYWPHFTAIPAPADEDLMIFTISKLTGHAGSRFGWAVIKDEALYQRMVTFLGLNTMGVSRDTQLRVLKILKVVLNEGGGREIFQFGYSTMEDRWEKLSKTLSKSKRFSVQEIEPQYCTFFQKIRGPSPAYVWLKCEREEDRDCNLVLKKAKIIGRAGDVFNAESRYARLSLIRSRDDFDLLLNRVEAMISLDDGAATI